MLCWDGAFINPDEPVLFTDRHLHELLEYNSLLFQFRCDFVDSLNRCFLPTVVQVFDHDVPNIINLELSIWMISFQLLDYLFQSETFRMQSLRCSSDKFWISLFLVVPLNSQFSSLLELGLIFVTAIVIEQVSQSLGCWVLVIDLTRHFEQCCDVFLLHPLAKHGVDIVNILEKHLRSECLRFDETLWNLMINPLRWWHSDVTLFWFIFFFSDSGNILSIRDIGLPNFRNWSGWVLGDQS